MCAVMAGQALASTPTAAAVLNEARAQAKAEKKNVLVIFHASWCGWCKKFDAFLEDAAMKPLIDRNFVVLHITVLEAKDHKNDENPGGDDLFKSLGGDPKTSGIPFFAFVNPAGKTLSNSNLPQPIKNETNIGYPGSPSRSAISWTCSRSPRRT